MRIESVATFEDAAEFQLVGDPVRIVSRGISGDAR